MGRPERRLWLKLSLIYGIPVRRLQRLIDSREFTELAAYARVEGLPGDGWYQAGQMCAAVANSQRSQGKAASAKDFMPRFDAAVIRTDDECVDAFRQQASIVNGVKVR